MAMSRHRKNAEIFIDRSHFSEKIDWSKVEAIEAKKDKKEELISQVTRQAGHMMSRETAKDTSQDYEKKRVPELVTAGVRLLAEKLDSKALSLSKQIDLVFEIATSQRASSSRIQSPAEELSSYQKRAIEMIEKGTFKLGDFKLLKAQIMSLGSGYEVEASEKMAQKNALLKERLTPLVEKGKVLQRQRDRSLD